MVIKKEMKACEVDESMIRDKEGGKEKYNFLILSVQNKYENKKIKKFF